MTEESQEESFGVSRRQTLTGTATALGALALTGCTSEGKREEINSVFQAPDDSPPRPPTGSIDNEYWNYVINSIHWQNQQIQAQSKGITLLMEQDGYSENQKGGEK